MFRRFRFRPDNTFILVILFVAAAAGPTRSQSLIVGIPSADITEKGHVVLAHETQGIVTTNKGWNSFTFATYGIGKHTELAVSKYGVAYPASGNMSLGVGFKTSLPITENETLRKRDFKVTFGSMIPVSFQGRGVGFWGYTHASFRLPGTRTRITAGPGYGTQQLFGRTTWHAMVGVEQPLTKKFSLIGDWMSGTHDLAATIVATSWQMNKHFLLITGYKIPNNARSGKPALILEFAIDLGKVGER